MLINAQPSSRSSRVSRVGFTLIELLVVVTIIVVLLAVLLPSLDKAIKSAEKAACLVNQRSITQACLTYGLANKRVLPPWSLPGIGSADNYDWRATYDETGALLQQQASLTHLPVALGLLPAAGLLPTTKLGSIIHCPNFDNSALPADQAGGVGMDRAHNFGAGGSGWVDPAYANVRIVGSYSYRSASYQQTHSALTMRQATSRFVLLADMMDARFGGTLYCHPDGYNRIFGDGHGGFYRDREQLPYIRGELRATLTPEASGACDGRYMPAKTEVVFEFLAQEQAPPITPE